MRWINAVAVVGVVIGLCANLYFLALGTIGSVRLLLTMFLMWQAMGGAIAATLVLLGTAYQRARKRPLAIVASRTPRLIVGIAAAGMAGAALVVTTLGAMHELIIVAIAGVLLSGSAAYRHAAPWQTKHAVIALLASIAIVVLPREANWVSLTLYRSKTNTHRHHNVNQNCNSTNWNAPLNIASLARSTEVTTSLTGNVGELLNAGPDADQWSGANDGVARFRVTGHVNVGWRSCLVPLRKSLQIETQLELDVSVHASVRGPRMQAPSAYCSGIGTIQLRIDHVVTGFASCRDIREQLANEVAKQLDAVARQVTTKN